MRGARLGQSWPAERWGGLGLGHRRRARLCDLVVRRGLPIWEEEDDTHDPHQLSALCEGYFAGQVGRETLYREMSSQPAFDAQKSLAFGTCYLDDAVPAFDSAAG